MRTIYFPFQCDDCQRPINSEGDAMIEWIDDDTVHGVRVIHNPSVSPTGSCYKYTSHPHRADNHFSDVMSNEAVRNSLGFA